MGIVLETPIRAKIVGTPEEIGKTVKALTYSNKTVAFLLKKHYDNRWWKRSNSITWNEHLEKLKADLNKCLLWSENGSYYIRPGSVPYLLPLFDVKVTDNLVYPAFKSLPWKVLPDFEPYHYQDTAVEELIKIKHGNISLPTGTGKTHILLMLARLMGHGVVVITPSKSIFNELLDEFQEKLGVKNVGGYGDGKKDIKKPITIAIGKSLTMLKEGTEAYEFFSNKKMMLVDESHVFAAEQLETVCHGVLATTPYRLFVSATQMRNNGTGKLLQSIIGKTVLEMGLAEAIKQDYLCPLNVTVIETYSPDTRTVRDPMKCKRTHFLYNKNVAEIAAKIANSSWRVKKQSTLILVEELVQIKMLTDLLEVPFAYVHSASKKDAAKFGLEKVNLKEQVLRFNKGEVRVLIGTKAIATGTNIFPTHNTVNWVGGGSEIVTKQGVMGRSTRKLELSKYKDFHESKPFSMIYDFNIRGVPMLNKQLDKRISWYKEADGEIRHIG